MSNRMALGSVRVSFPERFVLDQVPRFFSATMSGDGEKVDEKRIPIIVASMSEFTVQCPSCGEWFEVAAIGPEDFGGELDYDCEVC